MTATSTSLDDLRANTLQLARRIVKITDEWNTVDEVDSKLGNDVHYMGIAVSALLTHIAKVAKKSDPLRTRQLLRESAALDEATEFYKQRLEHETDASIDIFDRLDPGIGLAHRALDVLATPGADHGFTTGELVEHLRQLPNHLPVCGTSHPHPNSYMPLRDVLITGGNSDRGPDAPSVVLVMNADQSGADPVVASHAHPDHGHRPAGPAQTGLPLMASPIRHRSEDPVAPPAGQAVQLIGISASYSPSDIECLVITAGEMVCGNPDNLSSRQKTRRRRLPPDPQGRHRHR